jgi:hypothetical protein
MPENYNNYQDAVTRSFSNLSERVIAYLPNILAAAVILLAGWIIGSFIGGLLRRGLQAIGIDNIGSQVGLKTLSERSGHNISIPKIVEWIVKWFFIIASIIAAADILGMNDITNFFYQDVLGYAGHVIVAMVILLLGMIAANFLGDVVESTVKAGGFAAAPMLGSLTKWAIIIFALLAALTELQIARTFLQDFFRALVAMFAIAGGLAFGLGGRDHARKVLDYVEQGITKRS